MRRGRSRGLCDAIAHEGVGELRGLLEQQLLHVPPLRREQHLEQLVLRAIGSRLRFGIRRGGAIRSEALRHLDELLEGALALGGASLRVQHRAQRRLGARRLVGEQSLREVREGLLDERVVLVGGEPDALERGECARHVEDVGRHAEHLAVPPLHLLHDVRHRAHVDALRGELLRHLLLHLGARLGAQLLLGELGAVAVAPLLLDALADLLRPPTLRELPQHEREAVGEVGRAHTLELLGRREAQVHKVVGHRLVVLAVDVGDELDEGVLQVRGHRQRHPPVEDAQPPVRRAQQVAGVRVAVQRSRFEQHRQVGVDGDGAEARDVGRGVEVEPRPIHPLRHQHPRR